MLTEVIEKEKRQELPNRDYSFPERNDVGIKSEYSTFAEMFLEEPARVKADYTVLTITLCTFRNIPTIDDW
jgi:hypothetical protein